MVEPLTYAVVGLAALLCVVAVVYAARDRLIDDPLLVVVGLVELGLGVLLVVGLVRLDHIDESAERATFVAYLATLPLIPVGTAFLAIKEKSRWAMAAVAVGGFAVAVMTARLLQIWTAHA
ncbi:hypothetical protein JQN72_07805 [Phycicoccus sp. CSK15P-2]|uniref:hypothetical protein n=1 Tax=Phycicoccus sp. CSK15P-2 TaxID=2807627 RepID=UPI00195017AE|nr:hypothetical protein [Phycicoccus sp. CSK15P-2]MBM6404147.1 hypothetical protein [Phycicoccus sp. CSK15P-2]